MKHLKILLVALLIINTTLKAEAQIPVTDAAAGAQLGMINTSNLKSYLKNSAILTKTISTLQTLKNMKKTYDEWSDAVREVNTVIQAGKDVINSTNDVSEIIDIYDEALNIILQEPDLSYDHKEVYVMVFTKLTNKAISSMESSIDVTTNGNYEMNDSERLIQVQKMTKEVAHFKKLMRYTLKKMKRAIAKSNAKEYSNDIFNESINSVKQ